MCKRALTLVQAFPSLGRGLFQNQVEVDALRLFFKKRKEMSNYYWAHPEMSLGQMAKIFGTSNETVRRNALQFGNDTDKIKVQRNKETITVGSAKIINGIKHVTVEEFCKRTRSQRFSILERFNYKITRIGNTRYIPESFVDRYPSFMRELKKELNKKNPG